MNFIDTFEKHRTEPHISLDVYSKVLRLQLGNDLKTVKKIYLDTNYWLELRNAALGHAKNVIFSDLLKSLINKVECGNIICPISDENYYEILKQTDPDTLQVSAKLIDELSKGVALLGPEERVQFEILYFIQSAIYGEQSVYSPDEFIWTKVVFTYGTQHPHNSVFSPEEQLVIQKAFLDQMWTMSFCDMVNTMGIDQIRKMPRFKDITPQLNKDKVTHAHENNSFKQLFLSEIAGVLDCYKPLFEDAMIYLFEKEYGHKPTDEEIKKTDSGKSIANVIYNLFKMNKLGKYFPSVVIGAGLYASVRQDIQRKFKFNDMSDFRHAQAALPYFDYFFTENSLRDLIKRNNLRFDKQYSCIVESNPCEAVTLLKQIGNS
ncbi:MAG: hypothetical protein HQK72_02125 [Desulfamplus sp.]|nr:hypothetical protein [Desulfamplus sp.]